MKRINRILVLLLAICLVAGSVLPSAANAVQVSGSTGASSTSINSSPSGTGDDGSGRGDPGGAGDGLGADLQKPAAGALQDRNTGEAIDLLLQLLRLMQAVG